MLISDSVVAVVDLAQEQPHSRVNGFGDPESELAIVVKGNGSVSLMHSQPRI